MIDDFFNQLEETINNKFIVRSHIEKIKLDEFSGIIKGRLDFTNGVLEFL